MTAWLFLENEDPQVIESARVVLEAAGIHVQATYTVGTVSAQPWWEATGSLNIRSGPGPQFADLGDLKWGEKVQQIGETDTWLQFDRGWSSKTYLRKL